MRKILTTGIVFALFSVSAWAGGIGSTNDDLVEELKSLREMMKGQEARIEELEKRLRLQQKKPPSQAALPAVEGIVKELDISAGATFVAQGTPNANNAADEEEARFDGSYSIDLGIEKEFADYGKAFIKLEAGQGDTIEGDLTLFSNVNRDAGDSGAHVDVAAAWYEHYLFDGQLTLTAGKLDAGDIIDTNEYACDECTQFLGRMFKHSSAIDFPDDNALGIRAMLAPETLKAIEIETIYVDEDGDWEGVFNNPFIAGQVNFMPAKAFGYDEEKWSGNYRTYAWYNGAPHGKVKDASDFVRGNFGFGLSYDQKLGEVFGWFGRFSWQDPLVSNLEFHWSTGFRMVCRYCGREEDVFAVAVGQAIPGKEYGGADNPNNSETHLETYYACKINDHLPLSPDFQVIWMPNGVGNSNLGDNDTIFVYGMRGQIDI